MFGRLADSRTLTRVCLATTFIIGGVSTLRRSSELVLAAEPVTDEIKEIAGIDTRTERLVQANAGLQIAGGTLLAIGIVPRLASLALATSLVPTTLAAHRFWEESDGDRRNAEIMQFGKNAAIFGGLLSAALDTGGRPSVFWSGRQKLADATSTVSDTVSQTVERLAPIS
jgi:uncharacterized membrane protein YphA (DoxX/SURF4 family)